MSRSIDERIVDMKFNNRQFESGVKTSLGSLEKLKRSLDFSGSSKGLEELSNASRKFSFAGIAEGVDNISSRFSALGIVGVTALMNITNSAIETGKRLVKSLTIDPVMGGFSKYEQKTEAVQTILNATGKSIEEVNEQLDRLQWFTDETSYSYTDMVANIGKFTSMDIDLETSVTAMEGIANWAALSGQNAETASRAMFHLSKSMGMGNVRLMEWRSIEQSLMATSEFKATVIDTAKALGTLDKNGRTAQGTMVNATNMAETLNDGWLTNNVLLGTLDKYGEYSREVYRVATEQGITAAEAMRLVSDESMLLGARAFKAAQEAKTFTEAIEATKEAVSSGWAVSFEHVFGNYKEATQLWTAVTDELWDIFASGAESRNNILKEWKANDGRWDLIEGAFNVLEGIREILRPISEGFRDIFPAMTADRLVEITRNFRDLTRRFKIGEETAENLKRTFRGLFAFLDIGRQLFMTIARGVKILIQTLMPASKGLLAFTAGLGDWITSLNETIKTSDIFNKALDKIVDTITAIATSPVMKTIVKSFQWVSEKVTEGVQAITSAFKEVNKVDLSGVNILPERMRLRFEMFAGIGERIKSVFSAIADVFKKLSPIFSKIGSVIGKAFGELKLALSNAFETGDFNTFLDVLNSGLFAAILLGVSRISNNLGSMVKSARWFLDSMTGVLEGFTLRIKADALMKIALAIAVLAASLLVLSMVDSTKLTFALGAITGLFANLFGSFAVFQKGMSGTTITGLNKLVFAMLGVSAAVLILSGALSKLAKIEPDKLGYALLSITVLLGTLVGAMKILSNKTPQTLAKGSAGLVIMAIAVSMLAGAVKKLSTLNIDQVGVGLLGISVIMATLIGFMRASGDASKVISTSLGLIAMAVAVRMLVTAVKEMSTMPWKELGVGLLGLGGTLGLMVGAMILMPKALPGAASLIGVSLALLIFSRALTRIAARASDAVDILIPVFKSLAELSWEEIAKGLTVMGGALGILGIALKLLKGTFVAAMALVVAAFALNKLADVFLRFSEMSWANIGKGLLMMATMLGALALVTLIFKPLLPALMLLSVGILGLGVAMVAAGAGFMLFAAGVTAIAAAGTVGITALTLFVTAVLGLIPLAMAKLGEGVVAFAKVIKEGAPTIIDAIVTVIEDMIDSMFDLIPKISTFAIVLLIVLLETISENIEHVIKAGADIIINFMKGLETKVPEVIDGAYKLIIAYINGLADAIRDNSEAIYDAVENLIGAIIGAVLSFNRRIKDVGTKIVDGIKDGIKDRVEDAKDAGRDIVNGVTKGIEERTKNARNAVANVGSNLLGAFQKKLGIRSPSQEFMDLGYDCWDGYILASEKKTPEVEKTVQTLGEKMLAKTKDFGKQFQTFGGDKVAGMREALEQETPSVVKSTENMGNQIAAANKKTVKSLYQETVEWIDERKYYLELSLEEELATWERIQHQYKKGSDERKRIDREVFRVKREIEKEEYNTSLSWIDERKYYNELSLTEELAAWQRVQKRYLKGTDERKRADREVYRVKKELTDKQAKIDEDYYRKSQDINARLTDGIKALRDSYEDAVKSRTDSLYGFNGIFDEFREQQEINGDTMIINLTNQVHAFEAWQRNIRSLVAKNLPEKLMDELKNMGPNSAAHIDALNRLSGPKLDEFVSLWQRKYYNANSQAKSELVGMRADTNKQIEAMTVEADKELEELKGVWESQIAALSNTTVEQFKNLNVKVGEGVTALKEDTVEEFTEIGTSIKEIFSTNEWVELGSKAIESISEGIKKTSSTLLSVTKDTVMTAINAAKKALDQRINSDGYIDLSPTIKPVLDLTTVEDSLKEIFDKTYYLSVATTGLADRVLRSGQTSNVPGGGNTISNTDAKKINITNYYQVRNNNDIRKLNHEFGNTLDRYTGAKGVLVR